MTGNDSPKPRSALLLFTAENARSYRDEVHLSMIAGRLSPKDIVRTIPTAGAPVRVLPAAGIYGANASGKSMLLRAIADIRTLVLHSFRPFEQPAEGIWESILRQPFRLVPYAEDIKEETDILRHIKKHINSSTRYEVDLVLDGVRWLYRVAVDAAGVVEEYAYHFPRGRQALVFHRERTDPSGTDIDSNGGGGAVGSVRADDVTFGPDFRGDGRTLMQFVRRCTLLLTVAGAANYEPLAPLFNWFQHNLRLADAGNCDARTHRTVELFEAPETHDRVLALLRAADLGVGDAGRLQLPATFEESLRQSRRTSRRALAAVGITAYDLDDDDAPCYDSLELTHRGPWGDAVLPPRDESLGTLAWLGLIGPVLDALEQGSVLLVDELDSSLHPRLVDELVDLFQRPRRNPNGAQLIFNAQDVTLLGDSSERALARDEVWFAEKQTNGVTTLRPLSDFRPRHDEAVSRRYLQGRYGGTPIIDPSGFELLFEPTGT